MRLDLVPTPPGWAARALEDVEGFLSDHAHCEKKAATTALGFMQYAAANLANDHPDVVMRLARLAEQETNHLRRVLDAMRLLGLRLRPDVGNDYAKSLTRQAHDVVERYIVAACIEARSHERLSLIRDELDNHEPLAHLIDFFDELKSCEAGHASTYLDFACAERSAEYVRARLATWIGREAVAMASSQRGSVVH